MDWQTQKVILASESPVRRRLLEASGIAIEVIAAGIDEQGVRQTFTGAATPTWVVGADQVLFAGRRLFVKPANLEAARIDLQALRGRWHTLASAVAVAVADEIIWDDLKTARLKMRTFSDAFLESYIARSEPDLVASVGGYKLESLGVHLFERYEGDYFTILGLPLLPLLKFLRSRKCLAR